MSNYQFTSERLGFRNWQPADIAQMAAINADADVMEFFPGTKTYEESEAFVKRMQQQLTDKGYCYFAVDTLAEPQFIGFIGISEPTFESSFTPCTDIGWRLSKASWNKGYATEGAKRCLSYAFDELKLKSVVATAPKVNIRSQQVMIKAGMNKVMEFVHPLLIDNDRLRDCVLYEIMG